MSDKAHPDVRHVKSTSLAEYFAVSAGKGTVTVRQSNRFGTITCLTCRANQCEHIGAALPEIERLTLEQATQNQSGAESAEEHAA